MIFFNTGNLTNKNVKEMERIPEFAKAYWIFWESRGLKNLSRGLRQLYEQYTG